jgi:hypothetical protein
LISVEVSKLPKEQVVATYFQISLIESRAWFCFRWGHKNL